MTYLSSIQIQVVAAKPELYGDQSNDLGTGHAILETDTHDITPRKNLVILIFMIKIKA